MSKRADVVVVGAGAVGLCCAYSLRRRGVDVMVVDKSAPGSGCTEGNAGWIVPSLTAPMPSPGLGLTALRWLLRSDNPLYIALRALPETAGWLWRFWRHCNARDHHRGLEAMAAFGNGTMELYEQLAGDGVELEIYEQGLLFAFKSQREQRAEIEELEYWRDHGYADLQSLSGDEARHREPELNDAVVAGLFIGPERHVRPESLTHGLVTWLGRNGVEVLDNQEVVGYRANGRCGGRLLTSAGEIEAGAVVIAAGAWSGKVSERFGASLPVQAGKGYSITYDDPEWTIRAPLYLGDSKAAGTPFAGALRFGGTMELSGVNARLDRRRFRSLEIAIAGYMRRPPAGASAREWMGMRPLTPDGLPLIGRIPHSGGPDLWAAAGHGMVGITLAPSTGELLAALLVDGRADIDCDPFAPSRFA